MDEKEIKRQIRKYYSIIRKLYISELETGTLDPEQNAYINSRTEYVINKIYNHPNSALYKLMKNMDDVDFSYLIKSFFDINKHKNSESIINNGQQEIIQEQWIEKLINDTSDYEYRLIDYIKIAENLDFYNFTDYLNHVGDLNNINNKQKEYIFIAISTYLNINPRRRKHDLKPLSNYENPFDYEVLMPFYNLLNIAVDDNHFMDMEFITYFADVFIMIIDNTIDEFFYMINLYFDMNFNQFNNQRDVINKIIELINFLSNEIDIKLDELDVPKDLNTKVMVLLVELQKNKSIRFKYYEDLSVLKNKDFKIKKKDMIYNHNILTNKKKSIFDPDVRNCLQDQCIERWGDKYKKSKRTFDRHMQLIKEFAEKYRLNEYYFYFSHLPSINYKIDINNLLQFNIFYTELFILKDDLKTNNSHDKVGRKNTHTLIRQMLSIINERELDGSNITDIVKKETINQMLYRSSLYLTEKLRRGMYREYSSLYVFDSLIDIKINLSKLFNKLIKIDNIEVLSLLLHATIKDFKENLTIIENEYELRKY